MNNALLISLLVAVPCALLSVFLVLKGWALMGDAMSHAVFPGVVLAWMAGLPLAVGAFVAGLFCALATGYLKDNSRIKQNVIFEKESSTSDSALAAVFVPTGYDEFASSANSAVLGQIVQPWFYNQLRTEEQLGYAVFAFSMNVGRQWGLGFLLQSSDKPPAYLWQRYQAFFPQAEAKLRAMKPEEFAQIQQAVISQITQAPQTLGEEASKISKDFDRGNMRFDSRDKVVAEIKQLTPQKVADFFHQAVVEPKGIAILSQVSGNQNGKVEYLHPDGWKVWKSVSELQQTLPWSKKE
jgi:protease-3